MNKARITEIVHPSLRLDAVTRFPVLCRHVQTGELVWFEKRGHGLLIAGSEGCLCGRDSSFSQDQHLFEVVEKTTTIVFDLGEAPTVDRSTWRYPLVAVSTRSGDLVHFGGVLEVGVVIATGLESKSNYKVGDRVQMLEQNDEFVPLYTSLGSGTFPVASYTGEGSLKTHFPEHYIRPPSPVVYPYVGVNSNKLVSLFVSSREMVVLENPRFGTSSSLCPGRWYETDQLCEMDYKPMYGKYSLTIKPG